MDELSPAELLIARRSFLGRTGAGLGSLALATLLNPHFRLTDVAGRVVREILA